MSWFEGRLFSHPSWKIAKNLFFTETPCTTPVNSLLVLLKHTAHNSSYNSPISYFTTVSTTILSPPPSNFLCGEVSLIISHTFWSVHGEWSISLVGPYLTTGYLFVCLEQTHLNTQKTGMHTDLLLTYDWKFCLLFNLNPGRSKILWWFIL